MKSYTVFFVVLALVAVAVAKPGPPDCSFARPDCVCPLFYDPVCGTNGCTYGNSCLLSCAEATFDYTGECSA